jgi:hypothetical protein
MKPEKTEDRIMKSECSEHRKKIAALLLGDLTEGEKQALESHLATCSDCSSERNAYARTVQLLTSPGEEEIPHHFFVYPEERPVNPWQLFRGMRLGWQAAGACAVALFLVLGIAAVSRLQMRSGPAGWAISFGRNDIDIAALKKEILDAAEKRDQDSKNAWIREVRSEIESSRTSLTRQQKSQVVAAMALVDSRINGRIASSEGHMRDETQRLVADLYQVVQHDRAQDLASINTRFDRTDANNAIKTKQTNEILGTLLQVADLGLRK